MTGVVALARLDLALFVRSQRFVLPLVAYLLVVALLLSPPADPALAVLGTVAAALHPIAAWIALAMLGGESAEQRIVASAAIGGVGRAWAGRMLAVGAVVWTMALVTVLVPAAAGVFSTAPSATELLAALAATLLTTTGGALIGVVCGSGALTSTGWRTLAAAGALLATVPLSEAGPARFLLPPSVGVAELLDHPTVPALDAWLSQAVGPFLVGTALLTGLLVTLARRLD